MVGVIASKSPLDMYLSIFWFIEIFFLQDFDGGIFSSSILFLFFHFLFFFAFMNV